MEGEAVRQSGFSKDSIVSKKGFEGLSSEATDLINIYFERRLETSEQALDKLSIASNVSSLSALDIDNISLFSDGKYSLDGFIKKSNGNTDLNQIEVPKEAKTEGISYDEHNMAKQRELALKTLSRMGNKENINENKSPIPKNWFAYNMDPETPKVFMDELSSLTQEDAKLSTGTYVKENSFGSFNTQEDDIIHRLEEDEKKFRAEHSALFHNSHISEFSGIVESDVKSRVSPRTDKSKNKDLSIGEFFYMKSDRISSLIGNSSDIDISTQFSQELPSSTLAASTPQNIIPESRPSQLSSPCSSLSARSSKLNNQSAAKMKAQECHSNMSVVSNSTINIQNILADMESGLSGTEIYDRLIKVTDRPETRKVKPIENVSETTSLEVSGFQNFKNLRSNQKSTPVSNRFKKPANVESKENRTPTRREAKSSARTNVEWSDLCSSEAPSEQSDRTQHSSSKSGGSGKTVTITLEDTLAAGDLTILSQKIQELHDDSVSVVPAEEPNLLKIIQELAAKPPGSVDCSRLVPLLKEQYPELYSAWSSSLGDSQETSWPEGGLTESQDPMSCDPGLWLNMPSRVGYSHRISCCAMVECPVSIPVVNESKKYLLVSMTAIGIKHHSGKVLNGHLDGHQWKVESFLLVQLRDTVIVPSEDKQELKLKVVVCVTTSLTLQLTLTFKDLLSGLIQTRQMSLYVHGVNPARHITLLPKDQLNFGTLPEHCSLTKTVRILFTGACDLPFEIWLDTPPRGSQFFFTGIIHNGKAVNKEEWSQKKWSFSLKEGEEHEVEVEVAFDSGKLRDPADTTIEDITGYLHFRVKGVDIPPPLFKLPLHASVGFAKFLCNPSYCPLLLRSAGPGIPVTSRFPLKNVGSVPLDLMLRVFKEDREECKDRLFVTPQIVHLPKDSETAFNVTFTAATSKLQTRRYLTMQVLPNNKLLFDVELIGTVLPEERASSRASTHSACTATSACDAGPVKLVTSERGMSWAGVPLQTAVKETVFIKNMCAVKASARISFKRDTDCFKIISEEGEQFLKMRKILKPNIAYPLTVVFRPDAVGVHKNALMIETNSASSIKMIGLCGVGGAPKIVIEHTSSDLHGHKMIKLHRPSPDLLHFTGKFTIANYGAVPGFLYSETNMKVLSAKNVLSLTPSKVVVAPNSRVPVILSQVLSKEDLLAVLSGKDLGKVASVSLITGDEITRLRMRRLVEKKQVECNSLVTSIMADMTSECVMTEVECCNDEQSLEQVFLKSLSCEDLSVVIERTSSHQEPTILEDADDTCANFVSVLSAYDTVLYNSPPREQTPGNYKFAAMTETPRGAIPQSRTAKNIARWLETMEEPSNL